MGFVLVGLKAIVVPLVVFLVVGVVTCSVAAANGQDFLAPATWAHWDSLRYISLVKHGYTLHPCSAMLPPPPKACADSGWFPGYPLLIRLGTLTGISPEAAGLAVSQLFFLALLGLVWIAFLAKKPAARSIPVLALVGFWFGDVYYHAIFPMAPATFFMVFCLWSVTRRRWLIAGLSGAVATTMYPTMVLLAPIVGLWILLASREDGFLAGTKRAAVCSGAILVGYMSVFLAMRLQSGVWFSFFKIQGRFGHRLSNPLLGLIRATSPLWHPLHFVFPYRSMAYWWSGAQALAIALVIAILLTTSAARLVRAQPVDSLLVLTAAAFWIGPLIVMSPGPIVGHNALYRDDTLVVPAAIALRRLPSTLLVIITLGAFVIGIGLTAAFLRGRLV